MRAGYFDTEDDTPELLAAGRSGFDKRMTRICAVDHQGKWFLNHGERQPFLSWLQRRPPMRWYAHNCKYDLGNLFGDELDGLHWSMLGTRLIKAQWRGHSFMDSFNIWPMKLKKIGEAFGLDKLAMDIHSAKYVRRDVEILRRAMRFRQAIELTQNVLRAAGQVSKPETPDVQRLKSLQEQTRLKLVPGQQAMAALEYPPETVPVWALVLDRFRFVPFASQSEAMTWLSGVAFALQEWDWRRGQWHSEINPI